MLRPTRMKKIQILALEAYRYQLIKKLQDLGTVHLTDFTEKLTDPVFKDLLNPQPPSSTVRNIAAQNISVNRYLDLFERYDTDKKEGFIKGVFAPSPPKRIETREIYGDELLRHVNVVLEKIEAEIEKPVSALEQISEEITELEKVMKSLNLISSLDVDLRDVGESDYCSVILGIAPNEYLEKIHERLKELTNNRFYLGTRGTSDNRSLLVLVCLKEETLSILTNLRRLNWERIDIKGLEGTPNQAIGSINKKLICLAEDRATKEALLKEISIKWKDSLKICQELLIAERQRQDAQIKFARMENAVVIEGWIPTDMEAKTVAEVKVASNNACVIESSEPEDSDEVPVQLKNPKFVRSFELLTRLYGLPTYNGVDPTIFIVPGFLLFFSIMLTDAIYGVMAFFLGFFLIRGGGKYNTLVKDGGIIVASSGVATFIIGGLTGGWLGDFGLKLSFLKPVQIFDPMVQVTAFLVLALSIGLLHVNIGVFIQVIDNVKRGRTQNAIGENLWFLFVQPGIFFYILGYQILGYVFIIISLLLLFYGHKAMSMFQVTGYMGDILSYARLMALGLCTTGIAMTVNVLSSMLCDVGFIGIVFAVIVFLGGHIFNFVINAMGGFVHGLRLHYVEFFTKFYQSGGAEFSPLNKQFETLEIK
jgi:V/A-type H+/Na+-transporting ATPase subunit I